jgi:hypothetical protein
MSNVESKESQPITVFLNSQIHDLAKYFATFQRDRLAAKQTYLNTLAVKAVYLYLEPFNMNINLEKGECWQAKRHIEDIADLVLPNIGIIECRPVLPEDTQLDIPLEAMGDRIAYVVVKITKSYRRVELLGYLPDDELKKFPDGKISLTNPAIRPIDTFVCYLLGIDWLENDNDDDSVKEGVRKRLYGRTIPELVSQMNALYQKADPNFLEEEVMDCLRSPNHYSPVLVGSVLSNNRDNLDDKLAQITEEELMEYQAEVELEELAQALLERLKELWGDPFVGD